MSVLPAKLRWQAEKRLCPMIISHCGSAEAGGIASAPLAVLDDVPDRLMEALAVRAKRLSRAVMAAMAADGSFVALNNVVSQAIPHVHIHIVPRRKGDGLFSAGYIWKRVAYKSDSEREDVAARIRAAMGS